MYTNLRIIHAVFRPHLNFHRFLKKNDDGRWYDVGDRTAAEKTSQGLRERSNAEKRDRQALRESLRGNKDGEEEDGEEEGSESKKQKTSDSVAVGTLDYGANIGVPLTLSMKQTTKKKSEGGELVTAGLPPNAVDEEGNILVTDYDILCGRYVGIVHFDTNFQLPNKL